MVGTTIGERFEVIAFAGAGGMGRVYRARDRATGATVAVKLLPDGGDSARFAREAEVLSAIDHPGVVRYLAHGTTPDGGAYLAMEWLTGETLTTRLQEGTLSVPETLEVARGVAEALGAAHLRGVVHRDLKPGNLFLVGGRFDAIKLLDFGIARAPLDSGLTASGTVVGTPGYMAPEQVRGEPVDARADVYGVGAVLFYCLVGSPPFRGAHQLAVLAKVVLEPPPPIRDLRPDVPLDLEALVVRMLAKEPAVRPANGSALALELRSIHATDAAPGRRTPAAITAREQRVTCVVLCAGTTSQDPTVHENAAGDTGNVVRRAVEERGGSVDPLARGAWLITIPNAASPAEEATRAARCALALAAIRPQAPVFVSTGRVLVTGQHRVGEVIDRAAAALVEARQTGKAGGVHVDATTAELLHGRFRLTGDGPWWRLIAEADALATGRTLLGRPTPCVGREPQLALLTAMLSAAADEPRASAVLVTASPGLGKTHLVHELLRTSLTSRPEVDLLFANGDPIRAASPFGVVSQILRRAFSVVDSDSPALRAAKIREALAPDFAGGEAARMAELLGEICGTPTPPEEASPALRAARADASIMADSFREAWRDWIAARASRRAVLIVLEDLHWADAASIRLIEDALGSLPDRPILWLATARPGAAGLSDAFRRQGLVEITLAPLSTHASVRLVRGALGPADEAMVQGLVQRAGGNPFHLEELVRAAASGLGPEALPDSVLGMVQARFDELDPLARRVLRAASVFGETFWSGGIAALMGDDVPSSEVRRALRTLVEREVVMEERSSKWLGEGEYRFRHALLRDGAYATLAEPDRVGAHRRAGAWLETTGESDPAVLAEHYDRGASPERALRFFRRAATQALQHSDFERAMSHATRARAHGPDSLVEAALTAIEAEVQYWRGDLPAAAERATDAAGRLPRGVQEWFDAVSIAVGALGQLGRNGQVASWLEDLARVATHPNNRGAHVVALCRGMTQLFWAHHGGGMRALRARLEALAEPVAGLGAYDVGWVHRVRGESAWLHDHHVERCLAELDESCEAFDRARAVRAQCLTRLNAATLAGWSGASERGLEGLARSRTEAERLGAGFLLKYGRAVEGMLLAYAGEPRAEMAMRSALADVGGSPRLAFLCHVVVGWLALERGDRDTARASARAMEQIDVAPELRTAGLALAARVAIGDGSGEEALRLATEAAGMEEASLDLELTYGMGGHALAEVRKARGDADGARAALAPVMRRLTAIAGTIPAPEDRDRFWHRPLANASIAALAAKLRV
jgi:hypothetical protein